MFGRGGPLQPDLLVSMLLFQAHHGQRRGYARMIEAFWGEALSFDLEIPQEDPVTAQAFSHARTKLPPDLVRKLLHEASDAFERTHGDRFRWRGRRLLGVDGARRFVQRSDELQRTFGGPEGAHYPQIHVTTLFDVTAQVPLDAVIGPYGSNEREQLKKQLARTRPGDVLVLDQGYPSADIFRTLLEAQLDFVVRVPYSGSFRAVTGFLAAGGTSGDIRIAPRTGDDAPIDLRLVLDCPRSEPWVLLTTLPREAFDDEAIADAYGRRWRIEEFYKLLVTEYFGQGFFHAKWAGGVEQEVYAQMLFVAITRLLMATVSEAEEGTPYDEISQKGAILAVGDHMTRLLLRSDPKRAAAQLHILVRRIARARDKPRPGRRFPRRSRLPARRWGPDGRRGGA